MGLEDLHVSWEANSTIRSRFRREMKWLQWPIPEKPKNSPDEDKEEVERNPICTRSLELNVDAIAILLDHVSGEFVHVDALKHEAFCNLLGVCLGGSALVHTKPVGKPRINWHLFLKGSLVWIKSCNNFHI